MRDGGMVQRYQDGSLVERYYRYGPRGAGAPIARVGDASLMGGIYNFLFPGQDQVSPGARILSGGTVEEISSQAKDIASRERTQREIDDSMLPMAESVRDIQAQQRYAQMLDRDPYKPSIPPDPNIGKRDSSFENKAAISIEERKKRLESIFGVNAEDREYVEEKLKELYGGEISSWEKAQKWFDAAQAAIKPGQSNMQAAINALSALGGGYAQERAEERANNREMQQALLKYELGARQDERQSQRDIAKGLLEYEQSEIDRVRANEAASAEREIEGYKWQAQQEIETARMYKSAADDLSDNLNRRVSDLMRSGIVSPEEISKDTEIMDLTKRIEENNLKANNAVIRSRMLQRRFGGATGSLTRTEYADGDTMGYLD
jgi:hypothetical protein